MVSPTHLSAQQVRLPAHIVDLAAGELRRASGEHVDLRPRSFAVLRLLAEHAGELVSKDALLTKVWDDAVVTEDSLTQCITDIRRAIGDDERRVLRTVNRKGYLLVPAQRSELARREPRPSLAVMPFLSIDGAGDPMLGVGIAIQILNELARNRDLHLIARESSFALGNRNLTAQELGGQLGARYLVEGTAQRSDGTLHVDVQLVDAFEGNIVWGDRFSATARSIPRVQGQIAAKIAGSLRSGMLEAEKHAILSRGPSDLDVFELTLRGIARKHQLIPRRRGRGAPTLKRPFAAIPTMHPPGPIWPGSI